MLATGLPHYLPLEDAVVGLHEMGGNGSQNTCLKHLSEPTPLEHTSRIRFNEEKGSNSDFMWAVSLLATVAPSPFPYLDVVDCFTTQANKSMEDAMKKIELAAQTSGKDNWDGEGAIKVSPETIEIACKFVAMFPHNVLSEDLDIDVTPFGSIDFGWVLERDVMMNILVLPSREIGFSYSVHGDRNDGRESWRGTMPRSISEAIDKVFNWDGMGD